MAIPMEIIRRIEDVFKLDPVDDLVREFIAAGVTEKGLMESLASCTRIPQPFKTRVHNTFRDVTNNGL